MALQKVNRSLLNTGVSDSSDATAITIDSGEAVTFASTVTSTGKITADAGIDIDSINIDGTTISQSGSSDLTIDVGGRIDLSADDNGEIRLYDGSSLYAQFKDDDDRLSIQGLIQDKDILFSVNDGGSMATALKLDAASGGDATFYGTINGSKRVTLTNTSSEHLRLAYNDTYYWDITRESSAGNLTFDSSNVSGVSLTLGAANKKLTIAGGILFGTDTADANTLDDYEEGTCTMTNFSGVFGSTGNHAHDYAIYTKIGNLIHIQGRITFTVSSTGEQGFTFYTPFAMATTSEVGQLGVCSAYNDATNQACGYIIDNTGSNNNQLFLHTNLSSTSSPSVTYSLTYRTA